MATLGDTTATKIDVLNGGTSGGNINPTADNTLSLGTASLRWKLNGTTVPANPVFTDTHYTTHLYAGTGTAANATTTNGNTKITVADNTTARDSVTLKGTGGTTVVSNASGVITIDSSDTQYNAQTISVGSAAAGTAIAADDITGWSAGSAASATSSQGVVTFTNGTAPTLSYTARTIPNISVTNKTVMSGISATQSGITIPSTAGYHNSIFRGMNLGTTITTEQSAMITAGTFDDLYVGDYWENGGKKYRIAGFDILLHTGSTEISHHHAVIVPDATMFDAVMNDTATSTGAYANSKMATNGGISTALSTFNSVFGSSHVLQVKLLVNNAVSNGRPSGITWLTCNAALMSERQLIGCNNISYSGDYYAVGTLYSQFPLFYLAPEFIVASARNEYWLQDVGDASMFAIMGGWGNTEKRAANLSKGVRPFFLLV